MSPTIFLAFFILGMDFTLYALFQWTHGDKRRSIARRLAAFKRASQDSSPRPFVVASQKAALGFLAPPKPADQRRFFRRRLA